jgi:hypothetical protein
VAKVKSDLLIYFFSSLLLQKNKQISKKSISLRGVDSLTLLFGNFRLFFTALTGKRHLWFGFCIALSELRSQR